MSTKTAVVTGASRGLGRAIARRLADDGWALVVDGRDGAALDAVAAELRAATATTVLAVPGDVADPGHRAALAAAAAELAPVGLLLHNASTLGSASPQPSLLRWDLDDLRRVYEVNVVAPVALTQALAPHLATDAVVAAVTSDAAVEAYAGWGGYGSSKAALDQAFAVLAVEQPGWRVLRVDPGDMATDLHQQAFPGEDIGDRPPPEDSVPGLLRLVVDEHQGSGRYRVAARRLEVA